MKSLLPHLEKFLRPAIIEVLNDPLATTKLSDTLLAAQAFQHNSEWRRAARRMFLITCVAGSFSGTDFCRIFAPQEGYDEPEILPYSIRPSCLRSADGGHAREPIASWAKFDTQDCR